MVTEVEGIQEIVASTQWRTICRSWNVEATTWDEWRYHLQQAKTREASCSVKGRDFTSHNYILERTSYKKQDSLSYCDPIFVWFPKRAFFKDWNENQSNSLKTILLKNFIYPLPWKELSCHPKRPQKMFLSVDFQIFWRFFLMTFWTFLNNKEDLHLKTIKVIEKLPIILKCH